MTQLDEATVRRIVRDEMKPLVRRTSSKRIRGIVNMRASQLEKRLDSVEKEVAVAIAGYALIKDMIREDFQTFEAAQAARHAEMMTVIGVLEKRMATAENWIQPRARLEKAAVRMGQAAAVLWLRRWLPFLTLVPAVLVVSYLLSILFGG